MKQYEAILHFMVAVPPDTEGAVMSHGMKGNITPAMVRAGIGGSAGKPFKAACGKTIKRGEPEGLTPFKDIVNCPECRESPEFLGG